MVKLFAEKKRQKFSAHGGIFVRDWDGGVPDFIPPVSLPKTTKKTKKEELFHHKNSGNLY